jgi:hypothetical protein
MDETGSITVSSNGRAPQAVDTTQGRDQGMETNPQRVDEFRQEIGSLHIANPADDRERIWLIAGVVAVVAGVVLVIVGYVGASGTAIVGNQIPYLISGGVLGLSLVVIGAALFVRYSLSRYLRFWLIRSIYEQRSQTDRTVDALGRIEQLLDTPARQGQPQ